MTDRVPGFATLSVHAGAQPDPATGARATPIYQTTAFVFDDVDHAASLFGLQAFGNIYSRLGNPTCSVLEERVAALEGGTAALAVASGHAAEHLVFHTLLEPGDEFVAAKKLYGGSINQFNHAYKKFGWNVVWAEDDSAASFERAVTPKTKAIFIESIANPGGAIFDIAGIAAVAKKAGIPLIVDNTLASPYLIRPFEHGADIVVHSATKFLGGHGIAIGGLLVDGGRFDWSKSGKFPTLTEPYAGYHDLVFAEEFGPSAFIARARAEGLRDFGACMSPANAFYLLQGIETLPVRMARHVENALTVSAFLEKHPAVAWVKYPGLESHPDHALAKKQMPRGAGAMMSFGIKAPEGSGDGGARRAGKVLIERVRLLSHLANVGDAKSLVIHPASTTHQQMSSEELRKAGVGEELVRLSIGLEDARDIVEDLDQALKASQRT